MTNESAAALRGRIAQLFSRDIDTAIDDLLFDSLARDVFEYQFEYSSPYAAYCKRRGLTPARIAHWTEIPPVPTAAFKEVVLVSGDVADTQRVFLYELYRDEEVLQKHLRSERVAKTRGAYAEFIESRKITRCSVA